MQVGKPTSKKSIAGRLEQVLGERSPWKWGKRVHLNDNTVSRILKLNRLPDPLTLVPAMRIENLSLDWLIDGRGPPHPVAWPASEQEAAAWIRQHMKEDSGAQILIVFSDAAFTPVLHSLVDVLPNDTKPYRYRATTIVGGASYSTEMVKLLRSYATPTVSMAKGSPVTSVEVAESVREQLSRGEVGNYALFGDDLESGLYGESIADVGQLRSTAYPRSASRPLISGVREDSSPWLDPQQRELHMLYASLDEADRRAAIRMLRGLHNAGD